MTLPLTPISYGSLPLSQASYLGPVFNLKDYGAQGDGSTDDTTAIAEAIDAMPVQGSYSGSGVLLVPPGDFRHRGVTLPANKRIHLMGAGAGISTLRLLGGVNGDSLTLAARSGGSDGWWHEVSHVQIDGNKVANSSGHGIVNLATRTLIHHAHVTNCASDGIHSDPASFALSSSGNQYHQLYLVSNAGSGLYLGLQGYDPFLTDVFSYLNGGDGIRALTTNIFAKGIHAANNTGHGVSLIGSNAGYGMWEAVYAHLNTLRGLNISGAGETGHRFGNCQFIANGAGGAYVATPNGRVGIFASAVKDNTGPGIEIADSNFNSIVACQFFDFQGLKTQTYGVVSTGTADYQTIVGNVCRAADHLTGDMSLAGNHNTVSSNGGSVSTLQERIAVNDGITMKLKAGSPSDVDFSTTPTDGTVAFDSNAGKMFIRLAGGTWKFSDVFIGNPIANKTASYTLSSNDRTVIVDATGGTVPIALPSSAGLSGRHYTVKKKDSSANAVTVGTTSAQTIDGAATYTLGSQWKYVTVESDGSNWIVVANN